MVNFCPMLLKSLYRSLRGLFRYEMKFPTYADSVRTRIFLSPDPVRYASLALALERLTAENVAGSFAEVGVWRGYTSRFMHDQAPNRKLYLFDTFSGFPSLYANDNGHERFRGTGVELVKRNIGNTEGVEFRVGIFPQTAGGLEDERFAFVLSDTDKYEPTRAALEFFYPRLSPGGYFMLHDYNSPESDHAIKRAADEFLRDKPEALIELPDVWGTALFRKQK